MRTYVFEDVLRRTLKGLGYDVTHVMNITDVGHLQSDADTGEDKMTLAVAREKKSPWDIARFYEDKFFEHAQMLGIERPDIVCRATDHVPEMIAMVETLIRKGFAYESGGNVYFDVAAFPRYPEFARLNMTGQKATDRVDFDSLKRSQADFALWFSQSKFPNQVMKWDSPWGEGFPGWHIECSAMAIKYLGERIDIHCGGIDHIPVHHTNEIAQSECCVDHDHAWVNYWMHGAFLTVDKEKMSKSKGDVLTVDKLARDGFNPLSYRYLLLTAHYRGELRFNYDVLEAAEGAYKTLFEKVQEWRAETPDEKGLSPKAQEYRAAFWDAMRNDLHSPRALSVAWSVARADDISNRDKLTLFRQFDGVFALGLCAGQAHALSANERALLDQREAARLRKDWRESDRLRDVLLNEHGVQIRDTKDGVEWVRTI
jgi:cysteinyl-tRNA synthetase